MNGLLTTIYDDLTAFLKVTAWRMYTPKILGFVHAYSFVGIICLAVLAAVIVSRSNEQKRLRILSSIGWILVLMEIYKQLFSFLIVNEGKFDLWIIPFQLCSVPMYMCIMLPFVRKKTRDVLLTFMIGYTFVAALAALIYPQDMLKPYVTLTAHGFIWHGLLLFISLLIGLTGMGDQSFKGFLKSTGLFLVLSLAATFINIITEPLTGSFIVKGSYANMFYLSPFHPSNQPFVTELENAYGRPAAAAAYLAGIIILAGITDFIFRMISKRHKDHRYY